VPEIASTSEATMPAGTAAEKVAVMNKKGVTVVTEAVLRAADAVITGAWAGAVRLSVVLSVSPAGAPPRRPNDGVMPPIPGSDNVPAVPGTAFNDVIEPDVGAAVGCTLGAGVLPPEHPATIVPAKKIPTRTKRR
jgi:hypothetical protein